MHNKILHILRKYIFFLILSLISNDLMSQNYIGLTKNDIILLKGTNYSENTQIFLRYNFPKKIVFGKSVEGGFESFNFENNIVTRYIKFGLFDEEVVLKIINSNNENFKRVDVGKKQGYFQWIDPKRQINFDLESTPMDNYLFISYIVEKVL